MGLMEYQVERMRQMPDKFYIIIPEPECVNVSFWYIPKRLRGVPHSAEREKILGEVRCSFLVLHDTRGNTDNFVLKCRLHVHELKCIALTHISVKEKPNGILLNL